MKPQLLYQNSFIYVNIFILTYATKKRIFPSARVGNCQSRKVVRDTSCIFSPCLAAKCLTGPTFLSLTEFKYYSLILLSLLDSDAPTTTSRLSINLSSCTLRKLKINKYNERNESYFVHFLKHLGWPLKHHQYQKIIHSIFFS